MRISILFLLSVFFLLGCGEKERKDTKSAPTDWSLRQKLEQGKELTFAEQDRLSANFLEQINGLNLTMAKSCRVNTYLNSLHFKDKLDGTFDGNFEMRGQSVGVKNQLTIEYKAYHSLVRQLEKQKKREEIAEAPESVKRQVLAEGDFHTSPVGLARCAFEDIPYEDISLPYFDIHCEDSDSKEERLAQIKTLERVDAICLDLWQNYLNQGEVDVEAILESYKP